MLETYYLKTLHELLEGEKQSTLVPIPYYLSVRRMFGKSNGPKKGIFGEYSPQQIQLDFILKLLIVDFLLGIF